MKKLVSGCIAVSMVLGMMAGSTAMAADDALDNIKERGKLIVATDAAWDGTGVGNNHRLSGQNIGAIVFVMVENIVHKRAKVLFQ